MQPAIARLLLEKRVNDAREIRHRAHDLPPSFEIGVSKQLQEMFLDFQHRESVSRQRVLQLEHAVAQLRRDRHLLVANEQRAADEIHILRQQLKSQHRAGGAPVALEQPQDIMAQSGHLSISVSDRSRVPSPVTDLTIADLAVDRCTLNWGSSAKATRYRCVRTVAGETGLEHVTVTTSHEASGLVSGICYTFAIYAGNEYGFESEGSCVAVVCVPPVAELAASRLTASSVTLSWRAPQDCSVFKVIYCALDSSHQESTTTSATNVQVQNLRPDTPYVFHVYAGAFADSNTSFETRGHRIVATPLSAVRALRVQSLELASSTSLALGSKSAAAVLAWEPGACATHYHVTKLSARRSPISASPQHHPSTANRASVAEVEVGIVTTSSCVVPISQSDLELGCDVVVFASRDGIREVVGGRVSVTANTRPATPGHF